MTFKNAVKTAHIKFLHELLALKSKRRKCVRNMEVRIISKVFREQTNT